MTRLKSQRGGMGKESLPWMKQLREDYPTGIRIYAYEGTAGAVADVSFEGDADFIVRAVNYHDDLVTACRMALPLLEAHYRNSTEGATTIEVIRRTLAVAEKAEGSL